MTNILLINPPLMIATRERDNILNPIKRILHHGELGLIKVLQKVDRIIRSIAKDSRDALPVHQGDTDRTVH